MNVAVVVNLAARRGSLAVAEKCRAELPQAPILASRSLEELTTFVHRLAAGRSTLLVSAGGDGSAVAAINALRKLPSNGGDETVRLALLPLGTGNGWANTTGAPAWRKAIDRLAHLLECRAALPLRRFDLLDIRGDLVHFAGTGWDAEILEDFYRQQHGRGVLPRSMRGGLAGYLHGMFTRTIPRSLRTPTPQVELVNTGEDALAIDEQGQVHSLPGGEHGKVLYRGPASICYAGTCPNWGFRFCALPFADRVRGRFNMRLYSGNSIEATLHMRPLWTGAHPVPKMHNWLLTGCRARFDRAIPFQAGGDRKDARDIVEYRIASEQVDMLDWSATVGTVGSGLGM